MSNDGGLDARVEDWAVGLLTALESSSQAVFKTVAPWAEQIGSFKTGGGEQSFDRFAPFAFVKVVPGSPDGEKVGGTDCLEFIRLHVSIGQADDSPGVARRGSSSKLGVSKIRELVFDLLNDAHPGSGFACDVFEYEAIADYDLGTDENRAGYELVFKANNIIA